MKRLTFLFLLTFCLLPTISFSQTSESEQQYKAAMQNAKTAFDAKMYSEALYFYREALKIKPDAKLPRYKIEDIRTIYIDDGIREIAEKKQITQEEVKKQAEAKADERIETEIEQAQKELETLKVATVISIDEEPMVEDDVVEIADVEPTLETKPIEPEPEPQPEPIEPEPIVTQPVEPVIEEPKPKEKAIEQPAPKAEEPAPKPVQPAPKPAPAKTVSKPTQKPVSQPKQMSDEEKKAWKENEIKKLRQQYPEQKTVLEFDQPGKHITRIIMNVDNEIMVYLKVKHSWGATFFFVEEIGEDLRSIDEVTFNKKTNLQNYGH